MINTGDFIEKLCNNGFTHLCVVPCSFAKNLINACINNSHRIAYVPCASEAVACSVAAGLRMSQKKSNRHRPILGDDQYGELYH